MRWGNHLVSIAENHGRTQGMPKPETRMHEDPDWRRLQSGRTLGKPLEWIDGSAERKNGRATRCNLADRLRHHAPGKAIHRIILAIAMFRTVGKNVPHQGVAAKQQGRGIGSKTGVEACVFRTNIEPANRMQAVFQQSRGQCLRARHSITRKTPSQTWRCSLLPTIVRVWASGAS